MTDLTLEQLEELERLEREAAAGPWRAGRSDMVSYDAATGAGPYKNVYGQRYEPNLHLGNRIPIEEARGEGELCRQNAELIAATRNALPALLAAARELAELKSALEFLHADKRVRSKYAPADVLNLALSLGWTPPGEQK